ncbi:hypothetical protein CMK11_14240 [Candidatus Poribacteria bacterium]|nr:hypothetical protein [Candidatus Poribacteria bacterium]
MTEYKFVTVAGWVTNRGLERKMDGKLASLASEGWVVREMSWGVSGFFVATLFIVLERNADA